MRQLRYRAMHCIAIVLSVMVSAGAARADTDDERLAALQARFRCPIFEYLVAIRHARHKEDEQNRFLITDIAPGDGGRYVQCAYFDRDQKLHCEAASSYYDKRLQSYFTDDRLKALAALGYSTVPSKSNYFFERPSRSEKQLYDIAGIWVETLGRIFDMQRSESLNYHAPLVSAPASRKKSSKYCAPLISLR